MLISIVVTNWRDYGDYMLFANLPSAKSVILRTEPSTLTALGSEDSLQAFAKDLENIRCGHKYKYIDRYGNDRDDESLYKKGGLYYKGNNDGNGI
jgi:hypothetical protein